MGHGVSTGADPSLFPSQILCVAEQINFTSRCERAIAEQELDLLAGELESQLQSYTTEEILPTDTESTVLSAKLKVLIMEIIHMIDVVKQVSEAKVGACVPLVGRTCIEKQHLCPVQSKIRAFSPVPDRFLDEMIVCVGCPKCSS